MEKQAENHANILLLIKFAPWDWAFTNSCLSQSLLAWWFANSRRLSTFISGHSTEESSSRSFVHSFILTAGTCLFLFYLMGLLGITIIIYFDGQSVPDLVSGIPAKLAPLPFWHCSTMLFISSSLSSTRYFRLILYLPYPRPGISHFLPQRSLLTACTGIMYRNQDLGIRYASLLLGGGRRGDSASKPFLQQT